MCIPNSTSGVRRKRLGCVGRLSVALRRLPRGWVWGRGGHRTRWRAERQEGSAHGGFAVGKSELDRGRMLLQASHHRP